MILNSRFDGEFNLKFALQNPAKLRITIQDISGKEVQKLTSKQNYRAGEHSINMKSDSWLPGVYFISFWINGINYEVKKLTILP